MEDIFLRKDSFKDKPWYNELCIFTAIGVCGPKEADIGSLRQALKELGYETHIIKASGGETLVCGGAE
ncbi:MAG: hypothetical protein RR162_00120 [Oscillospiraceae bacterium]